MISCGKQEEEMEKDMSASIFFADNERYADIINGIGCDGVPFVKGKDLQEMDTRVNLGRINGFRRKPRKKKLLYRDLLRRTPFGMNFAIIGIENQEEIDYALALRTMCYDAGEKEWDGAKDIHGLLDFTGIPDSLKNKVSNYQIHVVEVQKLENTDIFKTDVKQVFDFIRFSKNKEKLKELINTDKAYAFLEEDAYDMVINHTGDEKMMKIKDKYRKGGKVDMCQGLKEWMEDERNEGKEIGKEIGDASRLIISVEAAMKNFDVDLKQACEGTGTTVEEYEKAKMNLAR